jgi:hypothetical protein
LAAAVKLSGRLPALLAPEAMVIQLSAVEAVHGQLLPVATWRLPLPPAARWTD